MSDTPGYSILSYYFHSLSSKAAKDRTKFFRGGIVLSLLLLVPGSSAFAQTTLTPAPLAFGNHVVNVPSAVKKAWLTNTQTVPLTISSIAISGGNAPGDYALDAGGDCPLSPKTLAAGKYCSIPVTFTPSALGNRTATLTVADDATNSPQTVALTGTGTEPVDLTPSPLSFGNQLEGTTGAAKKATLTNYQAATLTNMSISASGDYARTGGTCPSSGGTLAAGASCTILLAFTPAILGSDPGILTVADSASNSPQTTALTGTGTSPVTLSVSSLYLGNVLGGNTSAAKTVTLTNKENVALAFSSIVTSGDFAMASNTCGTGIAAGAKCTVGVTFSPTATGTRAGALTFSDNAANSPQTVALTGIGSSLFTVSPASLAFAMQDVGWTSAAQTVKLTNHLTTSVTVSAPMATGDFAVASNNCPASVNPGRACTFGVTFTPTAVGSRTGALTVSYSAFGSPSAVTLSGTGLALVSIAVTPANPSIAKGTTQQFTATGTYSDGSTQNLTSTATWSSSAPGVATMSTTGLASAVGEGQTTIEAALGAINGSTTLTVTNAGSFVLTGSMNTARIFDTATLLNNGMVLVAGGECYSSCYLNSAELYNSATGTFSYTTGSMNTPHDRGTAALLDDGTVLLAGGNPYGPASAEIYDPATGTFTPTGSLNNDRFYATATLLNNGIVLMAGGYDYDGSLGPITGAELYDPTTGTSSYTGSMNTARQQHTATLLNNGTVLIAGGAGSGNNPLASAELYNPATGTFSYTTGRMNDARVSPTATLLNDGTVLIAGGWYSSSDLVSAELYNPTTETFSYTTGSLNAARAWSAATLLNNGMVLLAGGTPNAPGGMASAELYDPASQTFSYTDSLNTARAQGTATLLNNGMVLMAGGQRTSWSDDLASAELFVPATLTPPNLESIAITPATSTLSPGGTQQFIATGTFSDGSKQQLASVTWTSSKPNVAQISNDGSDPGVGLAIAAGTVTITATDGSVSGTATLTVQ